MFPTTKFGQGLSLVFFMGLSGMGVASEVIWDNMSLLEYGIPTEVDLSMDEVAVMYTPAGDEVGTRLVRYTDSLIPVCILIEREVVGYQPVILGNESLELSELVSYPMIVEREFKAPCSAFTVEQMLKWGVAAELAPQLSGVMSSL